MDKDALKDTASYLVSPGKGILAADESEGTIKKRFDSVNVASSPENRRRYRQMLFTTKDIEEYISGVIMYDETLRQATDEGVSFPKYLAERGIVPGIKVDKGKVDMPNFPGEKLTEGLDGLRDRLKEYWDLGAKFTKWRSVISIGDELPSDACLQANAEKLALFAGFSQEAGFVPIVEPEVLTDGSHNIEKSRRVTYKTLKVVFERLSAHNIYFPGMLLKPNWVHQGKDSPEVADNQKVCESTLAVMREVVPPDVPGLVFLSGGDGPEEATSHIDLMNEMDNVSWQISFSFGRALQKPVLEIWRGSDKNVGDAQKEFHKRAKLNSMARTGQYEASMEEL